MVRVPKAWETVIFQECGTILGSRLINQLEQTPLSKPIEQVLLADPNVMQSTDAGGQRTIERNVSELPEQRSGEEVIQVDEPWITLPSVASALISDRDLGLVPDHHEN